MPCYCVVGGCNSRENRDTSRWPGRNFLLFHSSPSDNKRRAQWDVRINRRYEDIRRLPRYRVCSDHFSESDYRLVQFNKRRKLKKTAVPNTDQETGALKMLPPEDDNQPSRQTRNRFKLQLIPTSSGFQEQVIPTCDQGQLIPPRNHEEMISTCVKEEVIPTCIKEEKKEEEEEEALDETFFANFTKDRLHKSVSEWCICTRCGILGTDEERQYVCCRESQMISVHRGHFNCVTETGMFREFVLNEVGLQYARYIYSFSISDPGKRREYLKRQLSATQMQLLAYKSFVNLISSQDVTKKLQYVLPACVVLAIRQQFPNTQEEECQEFVTLGTKDGMNLH